jgi:hypothetical protein
VSPEAQRIAIAKACGFTQKEPWLDGRECWGHKDHPPHVGFEEIPDYLNDLNAMHEAETWLLTNKPDLRLVYRRILIDCSEKSHHYWRATAVQRAEAYLRALNLWQESPPPTP